jgi:hypothetical protein
MSAASVLPSWMDHDAFQRLPPGPKRYLWNWKRRQDIADGRARRQRRSVCELESPVEDLE